MFRLQFSQLTNLLSPVILQDVAEPVSHCDDGCLVEQLQQQPLYPGLLAGVKTAGGLVQDQDPRLVQHAAGDGGQLAVSWGHVASTVCNLSVQTSWQLSWKYKCNNYSTKTNVSYFTKFAVVSESLIFKVDY